MAGTTRVEAVLLDALGTLVALEPPAPRLKRALEARFDVSVSERDAEQAIAAEISYYRGHLDDGRDAESLAALRWRCAEAMHEALPSAARASVPPGDALVDALLESLEFSVFDDVWPALEELRERRVRLVVVSNWDVSLNGVLERLGLAPRLDGIVTSARAGTRKPASAIFALALGLAGSGPARALHVGDSVAEDIEGARAAGIEPVLVRRDGGSGPPGIRTIGSLVELAPLVDSG